MRNQGLIESQKPERRDRRINVLTKLDGDARFVINQDGGEAPGGTASISMLFQVGELREFRGAECRENNRNPTSDWFGSIQKGFGGDKEAF